MDTDKLDSYMLTNAKYFSPEKIEILREKVKNIENSKFDTIMPSLKMKAPKSMLLICIFLGTLGISQFKLGKIELGILKLALILGSIGSFSGSSIPILPICLTLAIQVWWIVDICKITKKTKEYNFNILLEAIDNTKNKKAKTLKEKINDMINRLKEDDLWAVVCSIFLILLIIF